MNAGVTFSKHYMHYLFEELDADCNFRSNCFLHCKISTNFNTKGAMGNVQKFYIYVQHLKTFLISTRIKWYLGTVINQKVLANKDM